jgi:hypothetical protein
VVIPATTPAHGTARRVRPKAESRTDMVVMTIVVCEKCGAQFTISHRTASQDAKLASRQAIWLEDQFVWDHIQESKHNGSINLPNLPG